MSATEASAGAGTDPATPLGSGFATGDIEDTLDLRLSDEFIALLNRRPDDPSATEPGHTPVDDSDLLDHVADWRPAVTSAGVFHLLPVRLDRDLPRITRWMNDPVVAAFWELGGPEEITADHLRPQLEGDGRSAPCLGVLDGVPMSYWEIYRADLDPLARHYASRPHDTGIHLLIGGAGDRGRGLGSTLIAAVTSLVLAHRTRCTRVIAEPDVRNSPSVAAFKKAGFRSHTELQLPDKQAALMVHDRAAGPSGRLHAGESTGRPEPTSAGRASTSAPPLAPARTPSP
ncbi:GNAT family N-acetyltransferase [Streptomyces sp. YIM 130001]|uniref:GNAT family N-acetyltransferase n=1 Tax=Streptomyces sp. YIM 130001 TaxID=2259644 RepID=UPI001F097E48|nr:GNAT family N-acetyltransferase [Streptomyces sp. YIM 130001]